MEAAAELAVAEARTTKRMAMRLVGEEGKTALMEGSRWEAAAKAAGEEVAAVVTVAAAAPHQLWDPGSTRFVVGPQD